MVPMGHSGLFAPAGQQGLQLHVNLVNGLLQAMLLVLPLVQAGPVHTGLLLLRLIDRTQGCALLQQGQAAGLQQGAGIEESPDQCFFGVTDLGSVAHVGE